MLQIVYVHTVLSLTLGCFGGSLNVQMNNEMVLNILGKQHSVHTISILLTG